jgi:hypothetical protein
MSETENLPSEPPEPEPAVPEPPLAAPVVETAPAVEPEPVKKARRAVWPVFFVLGFLILAGGEGYLWTLYKSLPGDSGAITALQSQVAALQQAPAPAPQTPPPVASAAPAPPAADNITVQANLAQNLAAVTAQVNAMETQIAADHGTLTTLQANQTDLTKLSAKIALLNRLDAARMALEAGQPLGDIPNAPPALAKFAGTPPPTESALILAFPAAARAAEAASVARNNNGSYWRVVLARLENLVTISDGSHVIIGAPAAGVIDQAQELLNAGDLAGAVAQLQTLSATTQAAMGGWLPQAEDLLAARAAIIALANQS